LKNVISEKRIILFCFLLKHPFYKGYVFENRGFICLQINILVLAFSIHKFSGIEHPTFDK